jgi:succinoglycan biosynthesis transport protein ExoP
MVEPKRMSSSEQQPGSVTVNWSGAEETRPPTTLPALSRRAPEARGALMPGETSTPTPLGLLVSLRRRWALALLVGLCHAALLTGVVWYMWTEKYTARTMLQVSSARPIILFDTPDGRSDFGNYQRAQVALIKSRLVLNSALRNPKVAELPIIKQQRDPLEFLEREIRADFSIAPEILRISITGLFEKDIGVLVDAVREAYLQEIVDKEQSHRVERLDKVRKLHAKYDDILRDKRRKLREMVDALGSRDTQVLTLKHKFALTQLNDLQMEYLQLQSQVRKTQLELAVLSGKGSTTIEQTLLAQAIADYIKDDPVSQKYEARIQRVSDELALMKTRMHQPDEEPAYQRSVRALAEAKTALETRQEQLRPDLTARMEESLRANQKTGKVEAERKLALLADMEQLLAKEVKDRTQEVNLLFKGSVDLEWLRDEIAQADEVGKALGKQIQALQVEMEAPPRITLLEDAVVSPPSQSRVRMAGLAGGGGFLLALLGIAYWEFRARRISNVDEVVLGLRLRLVGALPILPEKVRRAMGKPPLARDRYWHNLLTESIDATRTMLMHLSRQDNLRVLMVTSAGGGEGKTMLSCQLATSLVRAGWKVLLIDGDLRRPSVEGLLNMAPSAGLSEVLREEVEPLAAVQPGPIDGLWVLGAGKPDIAAIRKLAHPAVHGMFEQLRSQFEVIIVDSAPVLPVADAQLLSQYADGVLFSVLRDVSRFPSVRTAQERLRMLGARILGAVVTGAAGSSYGPSYEYTSGVPGRKAS